MSRALARMTTGDRELVLPVRIVSDWHLGHPASRYFGLEVVKPLLEGAGTLVMAGDGREELVSAWQGRADDLWLELKLYCEDCGVDFVALTGNHDPDASEEGWMFLGEGEILITHGDMIYETASPWSRELFAKRDEVLCYLGGCDVSCLQSRWRVAREVGRLLRPDARLNPSLLGYAKLALWPPERLLEIGRTWAGFVGESERFLGRFAPEVEHLVCGHFHRPGRFLRNGKTVWNTGSMMKLSRAMVIDYDGERLQARR